MGVIRSCISSLLFLFLLICADSSPVSKNTQSLHVLPYIVKRSDGSSVCEESEAFKWTYKFHDCFISRKYADGGRDLNHIVDRILDHGEACIETTSRECRPDFQGFISLLNKTISQMKDYAEMYLEEIHRGRENIKDLACIETSLNIKTYEDCFHDIVPRGYNFSEGYLQKFVQEGIFCANRGNAACSKEAKTSLNRIVRIILGVEQPNVEEFKKEIKTTETPTTTTKTPTTTTKTPTTTTKTPTTTTETPTTTTETPTTTTETPTTTTETPTTTTEFQQSRKKQFEPEIEPPKAPEPWMWYDYLAYPFVQAWKWVTGLFG